MSALHLLLLQLQQAQQQQQMEQQLQLLLQLLLQQFQMQQQVPAGMNFALQPHAFAALNALPAPDGIPSSALPAAPKAIPASHAIPGNTLPAAPKAIPASHAIPGNTLTAAPKAIPASHDIPGITLPAALKAVPASHVIPGGAPGSTAITIASSSDSGPVKNEEKVAATTSKSSAPLETTSANRGPNLKNKYNENPFVVSSESEDDQDVDKLTGFSMSSDVFKPEPGPLKKVATIKNPAKSKSAPYPPTKPRPGPGRPKFSKNKPKKGDLFKELKALESDDISIINMDEVSGSLRSHQKPNATTSSKKNDIDPDFDLSKEIDQALIQRVEGCIIQTETSWEDVCGLKDVKRKLQEAVVIPLLRPDLFVGFRQQSKGVLLYGPPGTGKTLLGMCAASSAGSTFFSITASDLNSKWMGEGEKTVAALFHVARKRQPSIIFIDEIDSLLSSRKEGEHDCVRRMKTELLAQWNGISKHGKNDQSSVIVIGATNRPMDLDTAALRRFTKHLYVPLPEREARKQMFRKLANSEVTSVDLSDSDISSLACQTVNYSAADITAIIEDASMWPMREVPLERLKTVKVEEIRAVTKEDVMKSLDERRPTCSPDEVRELENWKHGV